MRWPWMRGEAPDRAAEPFRDAVDAIDTVDPATLEVIELDAEGRLVGPPRWPADDAIRELSDHPSGRDPTGLAGIWEALAQS
jgi:hypothetical protein